MGAGVGTEKIDRIKGEKEEWGLGPDICKGVDPPR